MLLNAQLRLDVFETDRPGPRDEASDFIDAILDHHDGDHRAAMRELLLDADFLRDQLATAHRLMSHGYSRGWKPRFERV